MPDYGHTLRFGTFLAPRADRPEDVVALARLTEQAGLDLATFQDHPYQPAFLDTWTLMTWVAAQTTTLRIAPNVLNVPLRPPAVVAKAAASLDLLSGGRVDLALGAGGFWDAIAAMGVDKLTPGQSVDALAEAIDVIRALWDTAQPGGARAGGEHHRVQGAKRGPAPAHDVPIWLGAYKPRMLALTGRAADGWLPSQAYLELADVPAMNARIDDAAERAGRSPRAVRRLLNITPVDGPAEQWVETLLPLVRELGFSTFILSGDDPRLIRTFGEEVAPALREQVDRERAAAGDAPPPGPPRGSKALAERREGIDYEALPAPLAARAVEPGDRAYATVRSTYVHRGAPGLVLRPRTEGEVVDALAFAREQAVPLAVRSGGHGIAGRATNDGGIVLDLGALDAVEVLDPASGRVRLGAGARWGDVATSLTPHGLAVSSGDYGDVGVGGLATTGGVGLLSRSFGLTIDRVRAADVVLADGTRVRAAGDGDADLLWGIRGAGTSLGVVTAVEIDAMPLTDVVFVSHAYAADPELLRRYAAAQVAAPRALTSFLHLVAGADGPVAQLMTVYAGDDADEALEALGPLLDLGTPLGAQAQLVPYAAVVARHGGIQRGGRPPSMRSGIVADVGDDLAAAIDGLVRTGVAPMVQLRPIGGAVHDTSTEETAFAHRSAEFVLSAAGRRGEALDPAWDDAIAPHADGLYLPFDTSEGTGRLRQAFPGATLERLLALKTTYDPGGVFAGNADLPPALGRLAA